MISRNLAAVPVAAKALLTYFTSPGPAAEIKRYFQTSDMRFQSRTPMSTCSGKICAWKNGKIIIP
jgi:hypothetical protein